MTSCFALVLFLHTFVQGAEWLGYWEQPLVAIREKHYFEFDKQNGSSWDSNGTARNFGSIRLKDVVQAYSRMSQGSSRTQFEVEFTSGNLKCDEMVFTVLMENSTFASGNMTYSNCLLKGETKLENDHGDWEAKMKLPDNVTAMVGGDPYEYDYEGDED